MCVVSVGDGSYHEVVSAHKLYMPNAFVLSTGLGTASERPRFSDVNHAFDYMFSCETDHMSISGINRRSSLLT
jgi:hypothetical protein